MNNCVSMNKDPKKSFVNNACDNSIVIKTITIPTITNQYCKYSFFLEQLIYFDSINDINKKSRDILRYCGTLFCTPRSCQHHTNNAVSFHVSSSNMTLEYT